MSNALFKNNAASTLGAPAGTSDTTITLSAGTGTEFPSPSSPQYFSATIWAAGSTTGIPNEIVYVTSRSGDTLTVIRAQEGTAAQSWGVGAFVGNLITAGLMNTLISNADLQQQTENYAVDSGSANVGVIALSPVPASMTALIGAPIRVLKMNANNTGFYQLNVNGLGAQNVLLGGGLLAGGELVASSVFEVAYNGADFNLLSPPDAVYNSTLATMASDTIKANLTGGTAQPTDVPLASLSASLGIGGLAPIPQQAAGVGQWINLAVPPGFSGDYALPASGVWAYWIANNGSGNANVLPGGSVIFSGTATNLFGFAWRIG